MKRSDFYKKLQKDMESDPCFGLFVSLGPEGLVVEKDTARGVHALLKRELEYADWKHTQMVRQEHMERDI